LEIYIWVAISGLGGIEAKRGLDKNFPQLASNGKQARAPGYTLRRWAGASEDASISDLCE
jgi:hypothetical protein